MRVRLRQLARLVGAVVITVVVAGAAGAIAIYLTGPSGLISCVPAAATASRVGGSTFRITPRPPSIWPMDHAWSAPAQHSATNAHDCGPGSATSMPTSRRMRPADRPKPPSSSWSRSLKLRDVRPGGLWETAIVIFEPRLDW
jgi:hypothetical protein